MIENIKNNQISDILKQQHSLKKKDAFESVSQQNLNSDVKHETVIDKAMQTPTEDTSAVLQAKQLLLSGQLDTPENIRSAAEAIIKFGI